MVSVFLLVVGDIVGILFTSLLITWLKAIWRLAHLLLNSNGSNMCNGVIRERGTYH